MSKLTKLDVQLYDLFDDWSEIDPRQKRGITKEMCIAELQRVSTKLKHTPTVEEFRKQGSVSTGPIMELFSTWNKALDAADLTINQSKVKITKTQALAELKRVAKSLDHTPTVEEFIDHASMSAEPVIQLFRTWNKALDAAGLTRIVSYDHTKSQIIAELKRVAKSLGHTPTQEEFKKHGSMSIPTVANLCGGTWNKALDVAGLKRNLNQDGYTKTQVLCKLKCVAKHLKHTPTGREFKKHGYMCVGIVAKLFGTWNKALKSAGLKLNAVRRKT